MIKRGSKTASPRVTPAKRPALRQTQIDFFAVKKPSASPSGSSKEPLFMLRDGGDAIEDGVVEEPTDESAEPFNLAELEARSPPRTAIKSEYEPSSEPVPTQPVPCLTLEDDEAVDEGHVIIVSSPREKNEQPTESFANKCPVCGLSLAEMAFEAQNSHVNACLDAGADNGIETVADIKDDSDDVSPVQDPDILFEEEEIDTIEETDGEKHSASSSVFAKIMQVNREDQQWAEAARKQTEDWGKRAALRTCPFYKKMPHPFPFTVDAFQFGKIPDCAAYFLSHFHSDHYGGLRANWEWGPIYCSWTTARLVVQQLRVKEEFVHGLDFNVAYEIEGARVTLIEANHCPGSALFVFEAVSKGRDFRVLHCGDFRACPAQVQHPSIRGKHIDVVYLDTTYLNPKYGFPHQEDVIRVCGEITRRLKHAKSMQMGGGTKESTLKRMFNSIADRTQSSMAPDKVLDRLLVVVGTYSIGKEKIAVECARVLQTRIYANASRRRIVSCLDDEELKSLITADPTAAQVHLTSLGDIRTETLQEYLDSQRPHFGRVVGFRGTGWTYRPPVARVTDTSVTVDFIVNEWDTPFSADDVQPTRGSTATAACYAIPYSEHSSFRDLACFCIAIDCPKFIPTVNVGSEKSRGRMKMWLSKFVSARKTAQVPSSKDKYHF